MEPLASRGERTWLRRGLAFARARASWWAPLLVTVCAARYAANALYSASFAAFGRDQGIFHYVAWALSRGAYDYVDLREINGPFIHLLHVVAFWFGGQDEHRFRVLDLTLSCLCFAGIGALVAPTTASWRARLGWALAGAQVLVAHYMLYTWWDQGQRESFYVLFLLASVALQWHVLGAPNAPRARVWLALSSALATTTCFGKPTCALFLLVCAGLVLALAPRPSRGGFARALGVGALLGAAPFVLFFARWGDAAACFRILVREIPILYRYIWSKTWLECYAAWGNPARLDPALLTLLVATIAIVTRALPRRLALLVGFQAAGLITFFVQRKGFPYHLHAVTAATHLIWLASAAELVGKLEAARPHKALPWVLAVATLGLAARTRSELDGCDAVRAPYAALAARHGLGSREYWAYFNGGDFFALDMRDAAAFVRAHTPKDTPIQTYGMDPYVLFLAERESATPYLYSFELDVDAAREGQRKLGASEAERAELDALASRNAASWLAALERRPPSAFVLFDKAPFTFPENAHDDLRRKLPEVAAWIDARYRPAATFGTVRVLLPQEVAK